MHGSRAKRDGAPIGRDGAPRRWGRGVALRHGGDSGHCGGGAAGRGGGAAGRGHAGWTRGSFGFILALSLAIALGGHSSATGKSYTPPSKKAFFGVSDTGEVEHFKKFRRNVGAHPAVLQSFHTWGFHPWRAMERWAATDTRGMLSVGTAECYRCPGVISPRRIALGKGDDYPLLLNRRFGSSGETVYIRLFAEMNGHWNAYSAYNADGSHRGAANKTKWFRRAWRRFAIIVRGGRRAKVNARLEREGLRPLTTGEGDYARERVPRKLPRARVALMWVPQSTGSPNVKGNQPRAYWPGRRFVDWVGVDIYAKFPNFAGMRRIYRKYRGKPFVVGEWSPWNYDSPGFVNDLFRFARKHRRIRLLAYYQGFAANDPHRIWHYPSARSALRRQLNRRWIRPYAPGARRPGQPKPEDPAESNPDGSVEAPG